MFQKLRKIAFLYAFGIQQAQGYRHVSDNLSMLRSNEVKSPSPSYQERHQHSRLAINILKLLPTSHTRSN